MLVRAWTRLYTRGLPAPTRDARRAEIESDLWEFRHDPERRNGPVDAAHVLLRLLSGVPDDLCWHVEQRHVPGRAVRFVGAIAALVLVVSAAWLFWFLKAGVLPEPPRTPMAFTSGRRPPPPPPPPPPPCQPPGFTGGCEP
ncbi:MAG TPA: hypothetical protein VF198_16840 [Vicinamibacterales bacterium]